MIRGRNAGGKISGSGTRAVAARNGRALGRAGLETLEKRLVLAFDPATVPAISAMEDPTNPVVLFETTLGNVYIELYADDAPTFVENFINYVEAGRYADSLFHRRSSVSSSGLAVLQGGGFYFTDADGLAEVEEFDAIDDEANPVRDHDERTLSFAKAGADTATSQFFVNLEDNSGLQFLIDQKFTVFGRVLDDASWDVVLDLAAVPVQDIRSDSNISGEPGAGAFREAPVFGTYSSTDGFMAEDGVYVVGASIIKEAQAANFYENRLVFPGGFRGPGVTTNIELGNANDFAVVYQVILRYADGAARDQVITSGTVSANAAIEFRLFDSQANTNPQVNPRAPFSIEVWSTPRDAGIGDAVSTPDGSDFAPLVASVRHRDFNGQVSEQFYDATNAGSREEQWLMPRVEVDDTSRETFIVYQNLSDTATTVTIEIFGDTGVLRTITKQAGTLRRGGVQLSRLGLADGTYAVRVTADEPIVAAVTSFAQDNGTKPRGNDDGPSWNALGSTGNGGTRAYTSLAQIPSNGVAFLDVLQAPGSVGSVVTLQAILDDGTIINGATTLVLTAAGGHREVNLRDAFNSVDVPNDTAFTLRVSSTVAVSSQTTTYFDDVAEAVASAVPVRIGDTAFLSNGFLSGGGGAGVDDVITVFNPFRAQTGVDFQFQMEFRFSDGTTVTTGLQSLTSFGRTSISVASSTLLADVRTKIATNTAQFSRYTISVTGFDVSGTTPEAVPVLAQLQRIGAGTQVVQSNALYYAGIVPFTNAQFS